MYNKKDIEERVKTTLEAIYQREMTPLVILCKTETGELQIINILRAERPMQCFEIAARNFLNIADQAEKNKHKQ